MYRVPSTLLDDISLDHCQSPAIKNVGQSPNQRGIHRSGSLGQLCNRIEDRLVELIQLSSPQLPVEYLTYVTASPPKVDVILVVGHCILG